LIESKLPVQLWSLYAYIIYSGTVENIGDDVQGAKAYGYNNRWSKQPKFEKKSYF